MAPLPCFHNLDPSSLLKQAPAAVGFLGKEEQELTRSGIKEAVESFGFLQKSEFPKAHWAQTLLGLEMASEAM